MKNLMAGIHERFLTTTSPGVYLFRRKPLFISIEVGASDWLRSTYIPFLVGALERSIPRDIREGGE